MITREVFSDSNKDHYPASLPEEVATLSGVFDTRI